MTLPHIGQLLGAVVRDMETALQRSLSAAGHTDLRPAHFNVFRHLEPAGSRLTDLAERAGMTKQSIGELVRYLEEQGYVERLPDPGDGRASIIRLTARGERSREAAFEAFRRLEATWGERVGTARVAELRETLAAIVGPDTRSRAADVPGSPSGRAGAG
ncbi:MAG TPA: MarR family winged helix-turn-helix transcriptional regulator [Cryptosporangiaceae bacterium]|nr:MarR family winged helix-turn-helix transcriptional regulator [Cryptosporangiaceae bacterium]